MDEEIRINVFEDRKKYIQKDLKNNSADVDTNNNFDDNYNISTPNKSIEKKINPLKKLLVWIV